MSESELVYYIPIDNIYAREESHVYRNVDRECLKQKLEGFDTYSEPTYKRPGAIVGFNIYNNLVYKTNAIEAHQASRLDLNAPTEILEYFEASEEVLGSCQNYKTSEKTLNHTQTYIAPKALIGILLGGMVYYNMLNRHTPSANDDIFPEEINNEIFFEFHNPNALIGLGALSAAAA